jgi:hypothetical protein
VLWVGKHEHLLNVILEKNVDHQTLSASGLGMGTGGLSVAHLANAGSRKRARIGGPFGDDNAHDYSPEVQIELKIESLFKQQSEALKYVQMCFTNINEAIEVREKETERESVCLS